jgi:hypothetical protein
MTPEEAIKTVLTKFPHVRATPVRNVAYWPEHPFHNKMNLYQDAKVYAWKGDLLKAITLVLKLQNKL